MSSTKLGKRFSLRTKLELIEFHEKKDATLLQTAKKFDTSVPTVHKTLKNKGYFVKLYNAAKNGRSKKFSFSENAVVGEELAKWYSTLRDAKGFSGVARLELRKKVKSVAREHNIEFKVPQKWIREFVQKFGVVLKEGGGGVVKSKKPKPKVLGAKKRPKDVGKNVSKNIRRKSVIVSQKLKKVVLSSKIVKRGRKPKTAIRLENISADVQGVSPRSGNGDRISQKPVHKPRKVSKKRKAIVFRKKKSVSKSVFSKSGNTRSINNGARATKSLKLKKATTKKGVGRSLKIHIKSEKKTDLTKSIVSQSGNTRSNHNHAGATKSLKLKKESTKRGGGRPPKIHRKNEKKTEDKVIDTENSESEFSKKADISFNLFPDPQKSLSASCKKHTVLDDIPLCGVNNNSGKINSGIFDGPILKNEEVDTNYSGDKKLIRKQGRKKRSPRATFSKAMNSRNGTVKARKILEKVASKRILSPKISIESGNKIDKEVNSQYVEICKKTDEIVNLLLNPKKLNSSRRRKNHIVLDDVCDVSEDTGKINSTTLPGIVDESIFEEKKPIQEIGRRKAIFPKVLNSRNNGAKARKRLKHIGENGATKRILRSKLSIKSEPKIDKFSNHDESTESAYGSEVNATKTKGVDTENSGNKSYKKGEKVVSSLPNPKKRDSNGRKNQVALDGIPLSDISKDVDNIISTVLNATVVEPILKNTEAYKSHVEEKKWIRKKRSLKATTRRINPLNAALKEKSHKINAKAVGRSTPENIDHNLNTSNRKRRKSSRLATKNETCLDIPNKCKMEIKDSSECDADTEGSVDAVHIPAKRRRKSVKNPEPPASLETPSARSNTRRTFSLSLDSENSVTPKQLFFESIQLRKTPQNNKEKPPRRSHRLNHNLDVSTDEAEEASETLSSRKRRRRKKSGKKAVAVDQRGTLKEETLGEIAMNATDHQAQVEKIGIYEDDTVVDMFLESPSQNSTKKKNTNKIEILSDIHIVTKKPRTKSENSFSSFKTPASRSPVPDRLTPITPLNLDMSWSNLFPEFKESQSEDELVDQINHIEFQYDPDPFENVKIDVVSGGNIDEDECDTFDEDDGQDEGEDDDGGADGDDEFEEDDVPSSQSQTMPPPNQIPQPPNSMQGGYRPPMPPNNRAPAPRGPQPGGTRMPGGPRPPMNNRAPGMRPRAPLARPRGPTPQQVRGGQMRPRMGGPQNGVRPLGQTSPAKRAQDAMGANAQMKRKRLDVLTNNDDEDCQVICMQPKSSGLPQIESVQGGSDSSVESSIMKLSDSITLSVRNPPTKQTTVSPQKSEAKAVANVLASRGITVTSSGKSKESQKSTVPAALSLNGAVSIVASKKPTSDGVPTVDLTDDTPSPGKNRAGLPYRCDLCPAQYPNAMGLNKHRQTYHKTTSGMCELGVPLINVKTPGIMQKLSQLGINNYIPLPSAGPEGTYALPIISTKNPGNVSALGATQMLSLGPVRTIPRPGANPNNSPMKK